MYEAAKHKEHEMKNFAPAGHKAHHAAMHDSAEHVKHIQDMVKDLHARNGAAFPAQSGHHVARAMGDKKK